MGELVIRLVFSLAVVIGLLLLAARLAGRRFRGRPGTLVSVLHRQPISRHAAVTVVTVGSRVLVLGTTEQQVRVLAELDPAELEDPAGDVGEVAADLADPTPSAPEVVAVGGRMAPAAPHQDGPLTGSVLSPATWRRAYAAVTGRAS